MVQFKSQKVYGVNVNVRKMPSGEVTKGYKSHMRVEINTMQLGTNGQLNNEVVSYRAKLKLPDNNKIHGVKNLKVWNAANTGDDPSGEYTDGDEHIARISVDEEENDVTLTVQNHGGAEKLEAEYILITDQQFLPLDENYQFFENNDVIIPTPSEVNEVTETITEDNLAAQDVWYMRRHANQHIQDLFNGDANTTEGPGNIHGEDHGNAGKGTYTGPKKKGSPPTSSVLDLVKLIQFKIKQEKLSADDTFIIADFEGKQFIITMSNTETNVAAVTKILRLCNDERAADSFDIKNESTHYLERPEKLCKDIANGAKRKNHFVAPIENIKWISIRPKSSS